MLNRVVRFAPIFLLAAASAATAQETTALDYALALEQAVVEAIEKAEPSVVAIARVRNDGPLRESAHDPDSPDFIPNEYAAGVVVDRRGLILTAYHVLGDVTRNDYYVWVAGKPYRAALYARSEAKRVESVKAADPWMDLAVLKIAADDLVPITFGDGDSLKKGQFVIALGNPYAIARDGRASAARGIISNLQRPAIPRGEDEGEAASRETLHHYGTLIQTDARLARGTSGGALINLKGEMIGLITNLAAHPLDENAGGFAIPVDEALKRTVETLKAGRTAEYGFLGVAPRHLSGEERRRGQFGARIDVLPNTPADRAGLLPGDVVTHADGRPIADANALIRDLSRLPVAAEVWLTVRRGEGISTTSSQILRKRVVLSKKYVESTRPALSESEEASWRGLKVDYATAIPGLAFRQHSLDIDPEGCVAVVDVATDSPAWKAGLRRWSFIRRVEDRRVSTPAEFQAAVEAASRGSESITLELTGRNGEVVVRPSQ